MRRFFVGLAITAMLGIVPCQARGNDRQISQTIVKSLQTEQKNGKLQGFNIDLEVDRGTVHLKGTVSNEEQEKIALDIARRVEGVRQVYNELEIKPLQQTKAEGLTQKVSGALSSLKRADSATSRRNPAATRDEKVVETAATETVAPADETAAAKELATRIIERLKLEKAAGKLQGFSLHVEVDNGVAWLTGKAATPEQQNHILDLVSHVEGVKQVVNGLVVTQPTATPSDIAQQVIGRLQAKKSSGELKDFSVDVQVDQGIVWLTGSAASQEQLNLILDTARYVPGVAKVVNDLTIQGPAVAQAQQAVMPTPAAAVEQEPSSAPVAPQPLANHEGTIGSALAVPALQPVRPAAPSSAPAGQGAGQYVWVPANSPAAARSQMPLAFAPARPVSYDSAPQGNVGGQPVPINASVPGTGIAPARFDHPQMPQYAWPSYAPYPNYGAVTYPKQYSPMAWPYIGPFYPYPQVPLGWRKVELKWKDGWWQLDFKDRY